MNNKYIQQHSLSNIINELKQNYYTYNINLDNNSVNSLLNNLFVPITKDTTFNLDTNK
jgi:hypothetical protein